MYILKLLVILLIPMQMEARRRIFEGKPATDLKEMPFLVSVRAHESLLVPGKGVPMAQCGGTYIRPLWVLTATHCIEKQFPIKDHKPTFKIEMCMGAIVPDDCPKKDYKLAKEVYPHTDGKPAYEEHDILLVSIEKPWTLSATIKIGKLPSGKVDKKIYNNVECLIGGWGATDITLVGSDFLKQATVTCIVGNDAKCRVEHGTPGARQICVIGGSGITCKGDSGGPLLCKGEVIGVLRGGRGKCNSTTEKTSFYNMVQEYNDWIVSIAGAGNRIVPCHFIIYVILYFFYILN